MWFILTNHAPVLSAGASGMRSLPSPCYQPGRENRHIHTHTGVRTHVRARDGEGQSRDRPAGKGGTEEGETGLLPGGPGKSLGDG